MNNSKTSVLAALENYENRIGGRFKPDSRFYTRVGINPKRFGQLLRGDKQMMGYEARSLAEFFDISIDELC